MREGGGGREHRRERGEKAKRGQEFERKQCMCVRVCVGELEEGKGMGIIMQLHFNNKNHQSDKM